MVFKKQPNKIQKSLCTPLEAVAYTNEVLIVSGAVTSLLILLLASFAGNIDTMSVAIGNINDLKQEILNEKIDIISSEIIGANVVIVLTNYGTHDSLLLAFFSDAGSEITCVSNNLNSADMTIIAGKLLEITCPVIPNTSKILVVTKTHNILEAQL